MIEPKRFFGDFMNSLAREGLIESSFVDDEEINWLKIIAYELWQIERELEN